MTELEAVKRKNDVSRFISLLDDESISKVENFMIAENLQVDDDHSETLTESSISELLNFDDSILDFFTRVIGVLRGCCWWRG